MAFNELETVRVYLIDYVRNHALTEQEFYLISRMLRDIRKKYLAEVFSTMPIEEIVAMLKNY